MLHNIFTHEGATFSPVYFLRYNIFTHLFFCNIFTHLATFSLISVSPVSAPLISMRIQTLPQRCQVCTKIRVDRKPILQYISIQMLVYHSKPLNLKKVYQIDRYWLLKVLKNNKLKYFLVFFVCPLVDIGNPDFPFPTCHINHVPSCQRSNFSELFFTQIP